MMGERMVMQEALFYEFSLERHVSADHLLRSIDRFIDLSGSRMRPGSLGDRVSFHFPEGNNRARKPGRCVRVRPENNCSMPHSYVQKSASLGRIIINWLRCCKSSRAAVANLLDRLLRPQLYFSASAL
jgi:hypothetical protein